MQRYLWDRLNKHQVGSYAKYCVKAEFAMYGFRINETGIDEHGTYFEAGYNKTPPVEVQVRALRQIDSYTFMLKSKFELHERHYLSLALLFAGKAPTLYLFPSTRWRAPDSTFVDRDYEGLQSLPEWGLVISPKKLEELESYRFETFIEKLISIT
ncbi:MAG: DUF4365 domain-containing protein [Chloroflexota bacterium]